MRKLQIGLSSCLAGNRLRYDGSHKYWPELLELLSEEIELLPICPEVAIGMGIPRPAIQLTGSPTEPQARQIDKPSFNVTVPLREFAWQVVDNHDLDGYIFKSRSPSCGLESTPLYESYHTHTKKFSGIFSQSIVDALPGLPVAEETFFISNTEFSQFIDRCRNYQGYRLARAL